MRVFLRSAPGRRPVHARRQRGLALVYGLFMAVAGIAALMLQFNAGQLTAEKTRLVNTADAVAWSAGVMHARALNYTAYLNRALVANEVLVAQAVSVQSWARLVAQRALTVQVFPECADRSGYGLVAASLVRFGPDYAVMCAALATSGVADAVDQAADAVVDGLDAAIAAVELNKASIQASLALLHAPLAFPLQRDEVLQQVADANWGGAGEVRVEPSLARPAGLLTLTDDWSGFVQRYDGADRGRFAEVARAAAASDTFVRERSWTSPALMPSPGCGVPRPGIHDGIRRRGGTQMVGFDAWQAEDSESWWAHRRSGFLGLRCRSFEAQPVSAGEARAAADADGEPAGGDGHFGGARENALAQSTFGAAGGTGGSRYSGLPGFHDLAPDRLSQGDPVLDVAVRVTRPRDRFTTSDARSAIPASDRLNRYPSDVASDEMAAVSASRVYFARPPEHRVNLHGLATTGNPGVEEIGSLFNPYWQVRLIDSPADVQAQRIRQATGF